MSVEWWKFLGSALLIYVILDYTFYLIRKENARRRRTRIRCTEVSVVMGESLVTATMHYATLPGPPPCKTGRWDGEQAID